MTIEQAIAVSDILRAREVSHTIQVGVHPNMIPNPACRVDLLLRNRIEGNSLDYLIDLQSEVRDQDGLEGVRVHVSTFGDGALFLA